jgi:hypothetical protein
VPLALVGAGQSMLFAGLFRSVLADVPTHLGGIGSGVLITLQQSGLALGVATLGTLYLALAPHSVSHAFASVEYVQMGIAVLLAVGAAALPRFTTASANTPIARGTHPAIGRHRPTVGGPGGVHRSRGSGACAG